MKAIQVPTNLPHYQPTATIFFLTTCTDMLNGLINMGKRMLTYKVISEMQRYQLIGYQLRQVPAIAKYIKDIPSRDEKVYGQQLYEISMSREPRGAEKVL